MSFFITGMGEIYSGSPQRGITLALFRAASVLVIPFYSVTNIKNSYLNEIFLSLMLFFLVTIFSPFYACFISFKKNKIVLSKLNSSGFLTLFALCNIAVTMTAVAVFFTFFSIILVNTDSPPVIVKGDIAVVKKTGNNLYRKGEMVILKDKNSIFLRIIGEPGEKISYSKGRFSIENSELHQSVFTDNELKKFPLTDFDVISENAGSFRYPVIQNSAEHPIDITLVNDEYFAVPDDRSRISEFTRVKKENIYGRMEGLLFSKKRVKMLIKPYQVSE